MKKIFSAFVAVMFVLCTFTAALAQENETVVNETVEVEENETEELEIEDEIDLELEDEEELPSTTPDQPILWGLKRAMERIDLALTFNKAEKAKKGLAHAKQRLLEVEAMISEKKLEQAEKAQRSREKTMLKVKEYIEDVEDDPEQDIEDILELENEIDDQESKVNVLQVKLKFQGNLTEEQKAEIDAIMNKFQNQTGDVKARIQEKKDKVKIKIKAKTGKSDEEVEEYIESAEERLNISTQKSNRIAALTKVIGKLEAKREELKGINVSGVIGKLEQVRNKFKERVEEQKKIAEKVREAKRPKIQEIEVEVEEEDEEENGTEVEVEVEEDEEEEESESGSGNGNGRGGNSE